MCVQMKIMFSIVCIICVSLHTLENVFGNYVNLLLAIILINLKISYRRILSIVCKSLIAIEVIVNEKEDEGKNYERADNASSTKNEVDYATNTTCTNKAVEIKIGEILAKN